MRVLAISSPYSSHLMPLVPLLRALRARGDEVLILAQPAVVDTAAAAGLAATSVGIPFEFADTLPPLPAGWRPIEAGVAQVPAGGWSSTAASAAYAPWIHHARYVVADYLSIAREWRPDLVLSDSMEFSGLIVGGVLDVPTVHHRWASEPMTPAALTDAKNVLHNVARRHGLDGVPDPALVLVPSPPQWADPAAGELLVRPVPYSGEEPVPAWLAELPSVSRVCVSFGWAMVGLNGLSLVRTVVDAFAGLGDVHALVTLGRDDQRRLGDVPASVRLTEPTPLSPLLGRCDLVLHHGGAGTVISALAEGLPQLLLPQLLDQHPRCARIAESGAAITLGRLDEQNDPAVIRAAIRELIDRPGHRAAAADVRRATDALPTPAQVADLLADLPAGTAKSSIP